MILFHMEFNSKNSPINVDKHEQLNSKQQHYMNYPIKACIAKRKTEEERMLQRPIKTLLISL